MLYKISQASVAAPGARFWTPGPAHRCLDQADDQGCIQTDLRQDTGTHPSRQIDSRAPSKHAQLRERDGFWIDLDNAKLHNNNAIEAMEIDPSSSKRRRGPEIKIEGESERPTRKPGTWPPEKEPAYRYIPGQYKHMGSKRREFEKKVQFHNYRSDGAILNLAAHDPIDWSNIISIWK